MQNDSSTNAHDLTYYCPCGRTHAPKDTDPEQDRCPCGSARPWKPPVSPERCDQFEVVSTQTLRIEGDCVIRPCISMSDDYRGGEAVITVAVRRAHPRR
jgi:hypothetical protein